MQLFWLILVKVTVVGDNPIRLTVGSEALVQCFVPETVLEIALGECDRVLQRQGLRQTDVLKCVSVEEIEPDDDIPNFVKRDVLRARSSGQALTGTFFTSPASASYEQKTEDSNSSWEN